MDAVEPALSARHKLLRRYLDGEQSDDDDATSDGPRPLRLAPHEMLDRFDEINVCAPMVRYSKHAFRALVSQYDVQITTTPMILAQEFSRSAIARDADFSTSRYERGLFWMKERGTGMKSTSWGQEERNERRRAGEGGSDVQERKAAETRQREPRGERLVRGALVCQLAASDAVTLADAAELVGPWVDGVDINCGW